MKKRITRKRSAKLKIPMFRFTRVTIVGTASLLLVLGLAFTHKSSLTQSVAGAHIAKSLFAQTTIQMPSVSGALSYNIYYKKTSDASFDHAIRNVPVNAPTYVIYYLKKGESYQYKISALNAKGAEFWWSGTTDISSLQSM
jgi:hypothetical protein